MEIYRFNCRQRGTHLSAPFTFTGKEERQASRITIEYALKDRQNYPWKVAVHSINLILNLLHQYSGLNQTDESKAKGLCGVYEMISFL